MTTKDRPLMPHEPSAWANHFDLISARLGRERYGERGACELHTWREGGPTDYHAVPLFTADQVDAAVAAERERWSQPAFLWPVEMPAEVSRWISAHPPRVVPRDEMQSVKVSGRRSARASGGTP